MTIDLDFDEIIPETPEEQAMHLTLNAKSTELSSKRKKFTFIPIVVRGKIAKKEKLNAVPSQDLFAEDCLKVENVDKMAVDDNAIAPKNEYQTSMNFETQPINIDEIIQGLVSQVAEKSIETLSTDDLIGMCNDLYDRVNKLIDDAKNSL